MKNVNRPIRLPKDFRQTVNVLNADPLILIQRYIDQVCLYPFFCQMSKTNQSQCIFNILTSMMWFQQIGLENIDYKLQHISRRYFLQLIALSNNQRLSEKQEAMKYISIINRWEKKVGPLLNYPKEIAVEGGGVLELPFDFMLVYVTCSVTITALLEKILKRASLAMLYAHRYSKPDDKNQIMKEFFLSLLKEKKGIFHQDSPAQAAVRIEYEARCVALREDLKPVKSFRKRLSAFRALIGEWSGKMDAVKESKAEDDAIKL